MKLEELQLEWEADTQVDPLNLDDEALKTQRLHAKYLRLLIDSKMKLAALDVKYRELRQLRFRYYRGELSQPELGENGWTQYQGLKPIKSVMDELLEGDEHLHKVEIRKQYVETMVYFLEQIMNGIRSRGWDIKNAIEYKKFLAGQ
jgi:hypothetical protein